MLKFLLNFWLYPALGMFFAAGSSAIADAGTGGGDGQGSADAGGGNGSALPSEVEGVHGDVNSEVPPDDGSAPEQRADGSGDPNALVDVGDGRKIPQKYAELFKGDKDLREMYFAQGALRKAYPGGVREAIQLQKDVQEIGGLEAVEQLHSEIQSYSANAELFEKDQAKWIESSFADNSEASLKAFGHAMEHVAEHHPEQYDFLMSKVVLETLNSSSPVADIYHLLTGLKDNPAAQEAAKKLAGWYNGIKDTASKIPAKQINPQQKKLDEQTKTLEAEKQQVRNEKINSQSIPHMNSAIQSSLDKVVAASGFDLAKVKTEQPNRYERFMKDVRSAIHQSVLKDQKWLDRYSDALGSGDTAKCVRMLNARHDQAVNGNGREPGVVTPLFEEWFGPTKKVAPKVDANRPGNKPGTPPNPNAAALRVNAMPAPKDIDYNHPKTKIIDQVAMRRDGKLVTWAS